MMRSSISVWMASSSVMPHVCATRWLRLSEDDSLAVWDVSRKMTREKDHMKCPLQCNFSPTILGTLLKLLIKSTGWNVFLIGLGFGMGGSTDVWHIELESEVVFTYLVCCAIRRLHNGRWQFSHTDDSDPGDRCLEAYVICLEMLRVQTMSHS